MYHILFKTAKKDKGSIVLTPLFVAQSDIEVDGTERNTPHTQGKRHSDKI
jgi:hypothetical protein